MLLLYNYIIIFRNLDLIIFNASIILKIKIVYYNNIIKYQLYIIKNGK